MKKFLNILIQIVPVLVGYAVYGILYMLVTQIPTIGDIIASLWYVPFGVVTVYMAYQVAKDVRLSQN